MTHGHLADDLQLCQLVCGFGTIPRLEGKVHHAGV